MGGGGGGEFCRALFDRDVNAKFETHIIATKVQCNEVIGQNVMGEAC